MKAKVVMGLKDQYPLFDLDVLDIWECTIIMTDTHNSAGFYQISDDFLHFLNKPINLSLNLEQEDASESDDRFS